MSDYSKVQSIKVIGNEEVSEKEILKKISVSNKSIFLFVNTGKITEEVKKVPLIKKANVTRDFFGHIQIEVEEAEKIAYCIIGDITYVIDEVGNVAETADENIIRSLQYCPKISMFTDLKFLKSFAKEYAKIPQTIKNQASDIIHDRKEADETRIKFIMDNGKILYLRVEDMANQLANYDYEANMTAYSDKCIFSFEGGRVYMKACD